MSSPFDKLKKAREEKGLSIEDISGATNINSDFLQSIEEGRTDILPQVYVRAFLREFAQEVDLDPDEIIQEYEEQSGAATNEPAPEAMSTPSASTQETAPGPSSRPELFSPATIAVGITIIALIAILFWNFSRPAPHEEIPSSSPGLPATAETTAAAQVPTPTPPPEPDSLSLQARTTDTVWVRIVIDSRDSLEYIFRPNVTRSWKARSSFEVSLGKADAIEFTLNESPMGALGTRQGIVRDSLITRETLVRLNDQN